VKKRIADAVRDNQEPVAVTTEIQEELLLKMGIDPQFGISCLGKVNTFYENDRELMLQFYDFVAKEELACDEAELGPDAFSEKLRQQQKLQEKEAAKEAVPSEQPKSLGKEFVGSGYQESVKDYKDENEDPDLEEVVLETEDVESHESEGNDFSLQVACGPSLDKVSSIGQSSFGRRQEEALPMSNVFGILSNYVADTYEMVASPKTPVSKSKPVTRSNSRVDIGKDSASKGRKSNKELRETNSRKEVDAGIQSTLGNIFPRNKKC
ncbi:hypothetical protein KI387_010972, partial [Taxus chinensis]